MKEKLRITLVQSDIFWNDAEANISMFTEKISNIKGSADLIILPEMFSTGFMTKPQGVAEEIEGTTMQWMARMAKEKDCVLTGSLIITEGGKYFNRLIWMKQDGTWEYYDKSHLFRMLGEHKFITKGTERKVIDIHGWKVLPLICYDLRFPVWARNRGDYDILLCTASWPERRSDVWKIMLHARALENHVYAVGVNRVGKDGNGITYSGDSMVVNPKRQVILDTSPGKDAVETVELSYNDLQSVRNSFPAHLDADDFDLK